MQDVLIVADIGGTKTNLCVADAQSGLQTDTLMQFINAHHPDFIDVVRRYCDKHALIPARTQLGLSVAGPVQHNCCTLTNLAWHLDGPALQQDPGFRRVVVLNDLVATALGIDCLRDPDMLLLHPGNPAAVPGNRGIVSLGTGLGEATLLPGTSEGLPFVIPSEGGHKDFSVYDERSAALFAYARQQTDEHIDQEYLISGMALPRIRAFLATYPDNAGTRIVQPTDTPQIVSDGLADPLSVDAQALTFLVELVAREAANLALQNNCAGGIIIAGGMAKRLQSVFVQPAFAENFQQRGKFSDWLRRIPLYLCTRTDAPLLGMWRALARHV